MAVSKEKFIVAFLNVSGYKEEDIWGLNPEALTVVTSNGGKYQMKADGKSIRILSGPDYPNMKPAVEIPAEE